MFENNLKKWHDSEIKAKMKRITQMIQFYAIVKDKRTAKRLNAEINALKYTVKLNLEINKHGKTKIAITQF
jgi:hypothetical protein